ncbi:Cytoplasmic protein, partial [Monkeypox virus]
GHSFNV